MFTTFLATLAMLVYIITVGVEMGHVLKPLSSIDKLKVSAAIGFPSALALILFIMR